LGVFTLKHAVPRNFLGSIFYIITLIRIRTVNTVKIDRFFIYNLCVASFPVRPIAAKIDFEFPFGIKRLVVYLYHFELSISVNNYVKWDIFYKRYQYLISPLI